MPEKTSFEPYIFLPRSRWAAAMALLRTSLSGRLALALRPTGD